MKGPYMHNTNKYSVQLSGKKLDLPKKQTHSGKSTIHRSQKSRCEGLDLHRLLDKTVLLRHCLDCKAM